MTELHERAYIRHPTDIPLEVSPESESHASAEIKNLSRGGLAFTTDRPYRIDSNVTLRIDCQPSSVVVQSQVIWCESHDGQYEVGVAFFSTADAYQVRMVEQVCRIEQYRRNAQRQDGRELTQEQAALEWITLYANHFAQTGWLD
jgi:Tfp pilus assembly protein PilZ